MIICVANNYSETPGGRYISSGMYSGEDFRDNFLCEKLDKCIKYIETLYINLDGVYGYSDCFLEEAFGGLIRKGYKLSDIMKYIEIISLEDPQLKKEIKEIIIQAYMLKRDDEAVRSLSIR